MRRLLRTPYRVIRFVAVWYMVASLSWATWQAIRQVKREEDDRQRALLRMAKLKEEGRQQAALNTLFAGREVPDGRMGEVADRMGPELWGYRTQNGIAGEPWKAPRVIRRAATLAELPPMPLAHTSDVPKRTLEEYNVSRDADTAPKLGRNFFGKVNPHAVPKLDLN